MKKKSIIMALSVVILASTSIVPSYAAEPLPQVERSFDLGDALENWADQYVDECNTITDDRERYKHIVRLIADNLNLFQTYLPNEEAVMQAYVNSQQVDVNYYINAIVHLSNKCGLEAYQVEVYGNTIIANGRTNYMPCVYFDDAPYLTVIQNIEAGDSFDDYVLMPNGTYGVQMTADPRIEWEPAPVSPFHTLFTPDEVLSVIYDSDGTLVDFLLAGGVTDGNGVDKYYIIENATMRPISLEELLSYGYEGPY